MVDRPDITQRWGGDDGGPVAQGAGQVPAPRHPQPRTTPDPDSPDPGDTTDTDTNDTDTNDTGGDDSGPAGGPDDVCEFGWNDNGRFRLNLETDPATGHVIHTALIEARDHLFNNDNQNNNDVDRVDVIREVCERSLDTITEPSRRDRYRINIHLDTTHPDTHGTAVDAVGRRLPDTIARHLTCDGMLSPVFVADGIPLSVGRTQRIVPDHTRRHITLRDQGCRVPGCNAQLFLETHHIIHWEHDGPTDTWNLICLCPHHHRLHHHHKLGITGNADVPGGVVFTNAAGNPIAQTGTNPTIPTTPPPAPLGTFRHPLGERLDTTTIYFNPPRHHDAANRPTHTPNPAETPDRTKAPDRLDTSDGVDPPDRLDTPDPPDTADPPAPVETLDTS